MRFVLLFSAVLSVCVACAVAPALAQSMPSQQPALSVANEAPGAAAPSAIAPDATVDQILDVLDQRGKNLRDFTADVKLSSMDSLSGNESADSGQVYFQQKPGGDARVFVRFTKEIVGQRMRNKRTEYLLDNGWLWERDYLGKREVKRQVLRPGEKTNLLKLGEGPFPLPIGQSKESVHELFEVKAIAADANDPADTVHLQLVPKPNTQFARKFSTIDLWVDRSSGMPRRITTVDASGTTQNQTDLENLHVNQGVPAGMFALPPVDDSWTRHEEPFEQ